MIIFWRPQTGPSSGDFPLSSDVKAGVLFDNGARQGTMLQTAEPIALEVINDGDIVLSLFDDKATIEVE